MINLSLLSSVFFVENKTFKIPVGNNEDGSRAKFPALFSTRVQYCGREGRGEKCFCSEKADLYCGKSKNAQMYFFQPQVCLARSF